MKRKYHFSGKVLSAPIAIGALVILIIVAIYLAIYIRQLIRFLIYFLPLRLFQISQLLRRLTHLARISRLIAQTQLVKPAHHLHLTALICLKMIWATIGHGHGIKIIPITLPMKLQQIGLKILYPNQII